MASTTVTGVAAPSMDARLMPLLDLRSDVRRLPSGGPWLCCRGVGIARVSELLRGHPDDVAVLVSVELCSLTLQHDDISMANIVASGLFGDGAAAVVLVGDRRAARIGHQGTKACVIARPLLRRHRTGHGVGRRVERAASRAVTGGSRVGGS